MTARVTQAIAEVDDCSLSLERYREGVVQPRLVGTEHVVAAESIPWEDVLELPGMIDDLRRVFGESPLRRGRRS